MNKFNPNRLRLILAAAAVVYLLLFGLTFISDPLGQVPVLDARENIAWAERIQTGEVPAEPFYRALLYPFVLSKLPASSLPLSATLFGLCMHGLSALYVGLIARRLWQNQNAAWCAGLLFAFYPVALYFSGQVLDITFSITLFLAGLNALLRSMDEESAKAQLSYGLLAGVLAGLAVLARPNFLPAVLCFPIVIMFAKSRPWKASGCVILGLVGMLTLQGVINHKLSGEFRVLPWQGAYNLYAANREGANGKFYKQSISFEEVVEGNNTTRMESELFYRQATGEDAQQSIDAMNKHWRAELEQSITEDPARWLGLMGRKVVYVFNNWEQYNNLTYAYHKARWPILNWNPLGWGLLLIAASAGLYFGFSQSSRSNFYGIALVGLAYTAGLLLFFVSARFRLPLAPLLCVAAGGCVFIPQQFNLRRARVLIVGVVALSILSFANWFDANDRASFIQDELLLAKASSRVGDDAQTLSLAQSVLGRDPSRAEAQRLKATSHFNLWIVSNDSSDWNQMGTALDEVEQTDAAVEFIRGVYDWREGRHEEAIQVWRSAVKQYPTSAISSFDALRAVGSVPVDPNRQQAVEQMRELLER